MLAENCVYISLYVDATSQLDIRCRQTFFHYQRMFHLRMQRTFVALLFLGKTLFRRPHTFVDFLVLSIHAGTFCRKKIGFQVQTNLQDTIHI